MKLSIITINYNNLFGLQKTFSSISPLLISYLGEVEWVVIDGRSTDGSSEFVLSEEIQRIPGKKISEKDSGIYNAMNKGVKYAKGEYLLFLNSGDCLTKEASSSDLISSLCIEDIIYGYWCSEDEKIQKVNYPDILTLDFFVLGCLCHQATFFHRRLFDDDGYDESYKIAADLEFIARKICKEHCSYRRIDIPVCIMENGGISSRRYYELSVPERRRAIGNLMDGGVDWYDAVALRQRINNIELFRLLHEISFGSEGLKKYAIGVLKCSLKLYKTIKKII